MKRKLGSIVSTLALLAVAGGAAAVNVKILRSNNGSTSVLSVQEAADVTPLTDPTAAPATTQDPATAADPAVTPEPAATAADVVTTPTTSPTPVAVTGNPRPKPLNGNGGGKMAIGGVGAGAGHGDDDVDHDDEDGEHEDDDDHGDRPRGGFVALTPAQMSLLRVAALAQVRPTEARDAAKGIGSTTVINRVKAAANQVGVSLSELAAITDLPPERGRGHGGHDEEHEGDDD